MTEKLKNCPKCDLQWPVPCEQTACIDLHGECIVCRFGIPNTERNPHGSGAGTKEELAAISEKAAALRELAGDQ